MFLRIRRNVWKQFRRLEKLEHLTAIRTPILTIAAGGTVLLLAAYFPQTRVAAGSVESARVKLSAKEEVGAESERVRSPELIYKSTCGYCHGALVAPPILGQNYPKDFIADRVRNGYNAMLAFRPSEISDAELSALADYISTSETESGEPE